MRNGLVNNSISTIAIDAQQNKWIGTYSGVSVFDGMDWLTYTTKDGLISNQINHIAMDEKNIKWFATEAGVSKFDGKTWTSYTQKDGLADNRVRAIAIDSKGNKWFATRVGVSKFNDKTWTTYAKKDGLLSDDINNIVIDKKGYIWASSPLGVSKFDGISWTNYTKTEGLLGNSVYQMAVDSKDNKWMYSSSQTYYSWVTGGISKYDNKNFTNFPYRGGDYEYVSGYGIYMRYTHVYDIVADDKDYIWTATNRGVSKFKDKDSVVFEPTKDGLLSYNVYCMAIDAEGNKWFGTDRGISKLKEEIITSSDEASLSSATAAITSPNPFISETNITFPAVGNYAITITNSQGMVVQQLSQLGAKATINLEGQPEGMYLYSAIDANNGNHFHGKLLLNK